MKTCTKQQQQQQHFIVPSAASAGDSFLKRSLLPVLALHDCVMFVLQVHEFGSDLFVNT